MLLSLRLYESQATLSRIVQRSSYSACGTTYFSTLSRETVPLVATRPKICRLLSSSTWPSYRRGPSTARLQRHPPRWWASTLSNSSSPIIEAEVIRHRHNVKDPVLMKQRDEELTELERSLKTALLHHQSLLDQDETSQNKASRHDEICASLHKLRGIYEQLQYYEHALAMELALGEEYENNPMVQLPSSLKLERIASHCHRLGKLHMRLRQPVEAQRQYQEAWQSYEQLHGADLFHADKGHLLISMAGVQFHHRQDLDECLKLLYQSDMHFQYHGLHQQEANDSSTGMTKGHAPHPDWVKCLQHQGLVFRTRQDFQSALAAYQKALDFLNQQQADDAQGSNPSSSPDDNDDSFFLRRQTARIDVADMLLALDQNEKALEMYQLIRHESQSRRKDPLETTALDGVLLHSIGKIHAQKGEYDIAVEELKQACAIKERLAGEMHIEVANTLNALGAIYAVKDQRVEALKCFQKSLLIARMHSEQGDTAPAVMLALRNITLLKGEKVRKWNEDTSDEHKTN